MVIAESERMILRQFTWDDLDELAAIKADAEVMKYIGPGTPKTREEVRALISHWIEDSEYRWTPETLHRVPQLLRAVERKAQFSSWAMIDRANEALIGRCGLLAWNLDGQLEVEVGYVLARGYWGKGLATEAARVVRDYGIDRLGFDRLICVIRPQNLASQRVAQKLGMRHEKDTTLRERPAMIFSMTSAERL